MYFIELNWIDGEKMKMSLLFALDWVYFQYVHNGIKSKSQNNTLKLTQWANFNVEFSTLFRCFFDAELKTVEISTNQRRSFTAFSTTVEIFLRFSTLFRRKCPLGKVFSLKLASSFYVVNIHVRILNPKF